MSVAARLANAAWIASSRASHRAFSMALTECEAAQRRRLSKYLQRHARTPFGRANAFAEIPSAEDYARYVPVSTYADSQSDFDTIGAGDPCLRTADPVTHFAVTAGTSGPAKTIPYTAGLKREFGTAVSAWIVDCQRAHPGAMAGPAYWSVSPTLGRCHTPGGVPVGFEQDSSYLGAGRKLLIDHVLAVPGSLAEVTDAALCRRATAVLLLKEADLRLVSVWHPTFFALLCDWIAENWDMVLEDLRVGLDLPEAGLHIRPRPARAKALETFGPEPADRFWPRLGMISAWGDGAAARALDDLARRFPGVPVQPKGIIATEGFVSLPFRGEFPLAIGSHYFEFQREDGEVLPSWRLERGMRGAPVLTTAGGLYRYRIDDVLEVTGHIGTTPCVRFIAKRGLVSDLVGEKLDEGFVAEVIANVLRPPGRVPSFALLAPNAGTLGYTLFVEGIDPGRAVEVAEELDARLSENVHYALARRLGQLSAARVSAVGAGATEAYLERMCRERGQRRGDVKPLALSPLGDWEAWLPLQAGAKACHAAG